MTTLYKLTDQAHQTYGKTQWGPGVTHSGTGKGGLCGPGWIHAYTDPLVAVLLNPLHADIDDPVLWEAEGEVGLTDHGLKVGCGSLTTTRIVELPVVTTEQRVRFGILCARAVTSDPAWLRWAERWLDGTDRSAEAAWAAEAARAAWSAAWAAWSAARAAWSAWSAAWSAWSAAEAAARAARAAAEVAAEPLDLAAIAREVVA